MKKHKNTLRQLPDQDAAARIEERLSELRQGIAKRREEAIAAGRGGVTNLPDTPRIRRRRWEALAQAYQPHPDVREKVSELLKDDAGDKSAQTLSLGAEFLDAVERGDAGRVHAFLDEGFPTTFQMPDTGETALHIAAACRARDVLRELLRAPDNDFLIRDSQGRLPSELALIFGDDSAVARLLGIKEKRQAAIAGVKLARRP